MRGPLASRGVRAVAGPSFGRLAVGRAKAAVVTSMTAVPVAWARSRYAGGFVCPVADLSFGRLAAGRAKATVVTSMTAVPVARAGHLMWRVRVRGRRALVRTSAAW